MPETQRMTNCSGKLITSVVAAPQSSLLEQDLEMQVYRKYFHVNLLPFSEFRAWLCFHSTAQETHSQGRKIKRDLISSPVAQQAMHLLGHPVSACTYPGQKRKCWSPNLGCPRAQGVCMKLMSCRWLHTTNYSLHSLLSHRSLPCTTSSKAATSLWSPAMEQYSFGVTGSCMDFCLEVREVPIRIRQHRGRAELDCFSLLSTNRNPVFLLHPQERNSWRCWTSPSWWNLLRPCSAVSCGQWLLIHKVA